MGHKESTKDVDFLVPRLEEYERLTAFLSKAGYGRVTQYGWKREQETIIFDLYPGKRVYMTELLSSPLDRGGSREWKAWKKIVIRILNSFDLMITKMFRGTEVDIHDCLLLLEKEKVDLAAFKARYLETAKHDIGEAKVLRNLELLLKRMKEESGQV
jgi:hypothetical protein